MTFITTTYRTKSNEEVLIRKALVEDAENLLRLKLNYLKATTTIPLFDYEYSYSVDEEADAIRYMLKEPNCLLLLVCLLYTSPSPRDS